MKTTLNAMYTTYELSANKIEGWKDMTKTQLANGYCDAEENGDIKLRDSYFSALMCKYWYMVPFLYRQNPGFKLEMEDFVEWVEESILKGLSYKRWRDPDFDISKDPDGAEKVFNRCIWSTTKAKYKWSNQDVRKINYETFSINNMQKVYNMRCEKIAKLNVDSEDTTLELIDTTDTNKEVERQASRDTISTIIDYFVKKNDYLSVLIIDSIAYGESFKYSQVDNEVDYMGERIAIKDSFVQFEPKKVVSQLNKIKVENIGYYTKYYKTNQELLKLVINDIKTTNNKNLYNKITMTLNSIRNNKELLGMLVRC